MGAPQSLAVAKKVEVSSMLVAVAKTLADFIAAPGLM